MNLKGALYNFVKSESFGGVFLFVCGVLAIVVANSPIKDLYHEFFHGDLGLSFHGVFYGFSLHHWINDVLMAFFFLMVGLEIKKEILFGELNGFQKAAFPVMAAIGGMIAPGLIYFLLNKGTGSYHGFGIPMATDIAFALGVMMMLGKNVPTSLKLFLVTLAVADDLGAILVIAIFYTNDLNLVWLGISVAITIILIIMNKVGIKSLLLYLFVGIFLWFSVHFSHIHATIAAVVLAFCIPTTSKKDFKFFSLKLKQAAKISPETNSVLLDDEKNHALHVLRNSSREVQSPLLRLEHILAPWSAYFIMPIFAFANAGVTINSNFNLEIDHIFLGILLGLVVGKPLGIIITTFLCEKLHIAKRPEGISWMHILGAGMLAGIGFTMSIFVSNLAFVPEDSKDLAKISILIASLASGIIGSIFLYFYNKIKTKI
ncbi:Na+/H+ antiporter NhaA [Helicobacter sp. 13S00401-1]|uniref:sodium/proton antiporter NhaA n=1 Tax=Helicobacter sp. 13S00401-1 TaxID=1905758 RepID=UPI000BA7E495|nr:sodium/proton antiporter NhaA [Helicobacter sp. 13S00401-1]PAF50886.1 Na+/H+ antiporter NhaA [Helicobacter sp. 13S00401-1]